MRTISSGVLGILPDHFRVLCHTNQGMKSWTEVGSKTGVDMVYIGRYYRQRHNDATAYREKKKHRIENIRVTWKVHYILSADYKLRV